LKNAIKDTLPVLTGYVVLGFGFGIILHANGYGVGVALAMSVFIYAGSMQYVAIGLLAGGVHLAAIALTTLMVNARHLFYGISMLEKYKNMGKCKGYLVFSLTDETYSLVCRELPLISEEQRKDYYLWVSVLNHFYWVSGSVLGATVGSLVEFRSEGIDFALTALFLTVFLEQWLTAKKHKPAMIGVLLSVCSILVFGRDHFLIPAMIGITILLCMIGEDRRSE